MIIPTSEIILKTFTIVFYICEVKMAGPDHEETLGTILSTEGVRVRGVSLALMVGEMLVMETSVDEGWDALSLRGEA